MTVKTRDRLGASLLLLFVIVLWAQRDYLTPFGGIFPDRVMIIMAFLLVLDLILSFTPYASLKEKEEDKKEEETHFIKMVIVAVLLLLWAGLLRYFGFILSSISAFSIISWFLSERRDLRHLLTSVFVAVVLTYSLVYIFEHLLAVPLPKGTIYE